MLSEKIASSDVYGSPNDVREGENDVFGSEEHHDVRPNQNSGNGLTY